LQLIVSYPVRPARRVPGVVQVEIDLVSAVSGAQVISQAAIHFAADAANDACVFQLATELRRVAAGQKLVQEPAVGRQRLACHEID
jgi:hypothetical protein